MRVFVTGATGVLGRRVLPLLLADGHEVHAVVRNQAKAVAFARAGGHPESVDLFDCDAVRPPLPPSARTPCCTWPRTSRRSRARCCLERGGTTTDCGR